MMHAGKKMSAAENMARGGVGGWRWMVGAQGLV